MVNLQYYFHLHWILLWYNNNAFKFLIFFFINRIAGIDALTVNAH